MKRSSLFTRLAIQFLLILSLVAGGAKLAQADFIDDAINLYAEIESVVGKQSMPIESQYLKDSAGFIRCLVNGSPVDQCILDFSETRVAKDALTEAGVPSSFWLFMEALKYYAKGDYWNFAWTFGETVACAVLQIWTGGAWDPCGTFMEIYEFAKNVYEDYIGPALEWIEDAGAAVGCYVFGLGCDEPPPVPPDELAFIENYYRYGCEGVVAKESTSIGGYTNLLSTIRKSAMATYNCGTVFNIGSKYNGSSIVCNTDKKVCWTCRSRTDCDFSTYQFSSTFSSGKCQPRYGGDGPVNAAKGKYEKLVKGLWSSDVQERVLKEILQERVNFTVSGVRDAAAGAMNSDNPESAVKTFCENHFKKSQGPPRYECKLDAQFNKTANYNYSFDHFDRWISQMQADGMTSLPQKNSEWCNTVFWKDNSKKFAGEFKSLVSNNGCPLAGDKFKCVNAEAFKNCKNLLGSLGLGDQCTVNVPEMGKAAAAYVAQYFKDHGSKHPCMSSSITAIASLGGGEKPVTLACGRPTQVPNCEKAYAEFAQKYAIPVKVLQCVQGLQTSGYKAMVAAVNQALPALKPYGAQYPIPSHFNDPLLVMVDDNLWAQIGSTPAFTREKYVPASIDGVEKPTIWSGKGISGSVAAGMTRSNAAALTADRLRVTGTDKPGVNPIDQGKVANPALSGFAKGPIGAQVGGMPAVGAQTQQKVMSGPAPSGSTPQIAGGAISRTNVPVPPAIALPPALPDITAAERVLVGGTASNWGGSVTVDAARALTRNKNNSGRCELAVEYGVKNLGSAPAANFRSRWAVSSGKGTEHQWASVPVAGTSRGNDLLFLSPGNNQLQLLLDDLQQLKESNESNNQFRINVNVTGSCGAPALQPALRVSPTLPAPAAPAMRINTAPLQR